MGVLDLCSGGVHLTSVVGDGVTHTSLLNEAASLGGVGAAILSRSSSAEAKHSLLLSLLVIFLLVLLQGSYQVISSLTMCFPSVSCQIGLLTIGNLLMASAQTSGT